MTGLFLLSRIFVLSFTFLGAFSSQLTLLPDSAENLRKVGDSFGVVCQRTEPKGQLRWKTDKGIVTTHQHHRVHAIEKQFGNITGLTLIFDKIQPSDAGLYICENAHNLEEQIYFKLTIYEQMTFKDTPSVQNFNNGETAVTVRCEASGTPTPVIRWSGKEGVLKQPKYQPVADGLVIRNVTPEDAGRYTCLAIQPGKDNVVTSDINVNVLYQPRWNSTDVPNVIFRTKGRKAVMSCAANAYPQPVFRWFFRDTTLESNASEVTAHDDGIYRCEVKNHLGAIARNFTVIEGHLPGRPGKPKAKNITLDTLTLDFTPPKPSKHHNITGYNIELKDKNSSHQKHVKLSDGPPFIIKDLRPGTTYLVRLKAENELGSGDYSIEFEAKTSRAAVLFKFSYILYLCSVVVYLC